MNHLDEKQIDFDAELMKAVRTILLSLGKTPSVYESTVKPVFDEFAKAFNEEEWYNF